MSVQFALFYKTFHCLEALFQNTLQFQDSKPLESRIGFQEDMGLSANINLPQKWSKNPMRILSPRICFKTVPTSFIQTLQLSLFQPSNGLVGLSFLDHSFCHLSPLTMLSTVDGLDRTHHLESHAMPIFKTHSHGTPG